ncbi:unnamed protein product [Rotaria magnacalcarata]
MKHTIEETEALNAGQRAAKNVKVATSKKFQDAQHAGENLRQKVSGSVNDLEDEAAIDVIKSTQKQGENLKHQATDVRDKVKTAAKSEKAHAEGLLHKVYNVLTDINDSIITSKHKADLADQAKEKVAEAYSRQKTIKDTVIDTVSASAKSGAKLATDAAKTTGDYVVDAAVSAAKVNQDVVASAAKGKILEATDILKQKATKAAKVGSEYAEIFGEKVDTATETDNSIGSFSCFTEYADELLKQSKASKEIAKEKLDEVATEINASAKEFAADAVKTTGEHATQASERLHEKVPEAIAAGKKFAAKAVKIGHKYGKEALEQTEIYARQVYEAGKEKAGELLKDAK